MTKVLITGATGNVGMEIIQSLHGMDHHLDLYAGVRDIKADKIKLANYDIQLSEFDFTDFRNSKQALMGCDIFFLLRPPQISDVKKYFKPIIDYCIEVNVKHIVFLSVQGAEKSKMIPHHKIEKLIVESNISYTFLRPAYFMQNFTTTLRAGIVDQQRIFLPAGKARFTLIDVRDIGLVSANALVNISQHVNKSYELTSKEKLTFSAMAKILSSHLRLTIEFESPSLLNFFITKRKEKMPVMLILVMIMLHYFPRFQKEPNVSDWVEKLTGKQPIAFDQFVNDHKRLLTK